MEPDQLQGRRVRARGALAVGLLGLGLLLLLFFREQVVRGPAVELVPGTRVRAEVVPAARGLIVDRHGAVLAETTRGYALWLAPAPADSAERALRRLAPILELSEDDVGGLLARHREAQGERLVVVADMSLDALARIAERWAELDGVEIGMWPKRHYPAGPLTAHVVGVVGPRGTRDGAWRPGGGRAADGLIGQSGLERHYDQRLAGRDGLRYVELDERGRAARPIRLRHDVRAVEGETLRVSLDLRLQEAAAGAVPTGRRAAVAALDPGTGEVLALYSSPTFDPNLVAGPAFRERWAELLERGGNPALARTVAGTYRPRSAWGVATAMAAVRLSLAGPETTMPVTCRGGLAYGDRYFPCSDRRGHGRLTLTEALARQCDVYFYQLGLTIGLDRLLAEGVRLGFGRPVGVDLPEERTAPVPADRDAYARTLGVAPGEHEAMLVAAGQGVIEASPLKIAHFYAALAADGPVPAPRLLPDDRAADQARALDVQLRGEDRRWLREALAGRSRGTAAGARFARGGSEPAPGHEWFVGVGTRPAEGGSVVVAVVAEGRDARATASRIGELVIEEFVRSEATGRAAR